LTPVGTNSGIPSSSIALVAAAAVAAAEATLDFESFAAFVDLAALFSRTFGAAGAAAAATGARMGAAAEEERDRAGALDGTAVIVTALSTEGVGGRSGGAVVRAEGAAVGAATAATTAGGGGDFTEAGFDARVCRASEAMDTDPPVAAGVVGAVEAVSAAAMLFGAGEIAAAAAACAPLLPPPLFAFLLACIGDASAGELGDRKLEIT
jgi:hypothetical protein